MKNLAFRQNPLPEPEYNIPGSVNPNALTYVGKN